MENTLENKAKFFAQYFNQEVRVWKEMPDNLCNVGYAALSDDAIKYSHLLLTTLSAITDEDAIAIANIGSQMGYCFESRAIQAGRSLLKSLNVARGDYLRSKGYALPYMGLSVEKLIEYGWIKLKD